MGLSNQSKTAVQCCDVTSTSLHFHSHSRSHTHTRTNSITAHFTIHSCLNHVSTRGSLTKRTCHLSLVITTPGQKDAVSKASPSAFQLFQHQPLNFCLKGRKSEGNSLIRSQKHSIITFPERSAFKTTFSAKSNPHSSKSRFPEQVPFETKIRHEDSTRSKSKSKSLSECSRLVTRPSGGRP